MHNPKNITIEDFDYLLPDERVAKYPLVRRDESKLLRYRQGTITEHVFKDVPALLPENSLLIFNETKVVQARLYFKKATGAKIEVFILEPFESDIQSAFQSTGPSLWKCFVGNAKKWKSGSLVMNVDDNITVYAEKVKPEENAYVVRLSWNSNITFSELLMRAGEIPLPPYLKREAEPLDRKRYQTIFAKNDGSVAAPTAGLHFTPEILEAIGTKGIPSEKVTLHVGAGTFKPVIEEKIGNHAMHDEKIVVSLKTLQHLHANAGKRFTPVGTTSVRTLESIYWFGGKIAEQGCRATFDIPQWLPYKEHASLTRKEALKKVIDFLTANNLEQLTGQTRLMIVPGYTYKMADAMFTNFHQPKSTLLLLVSAFIGVRWKKVYQFALEHGFRFLSYGDSCYLIKEK